MLFLIVAVLLFLLQNLSFKEFSRRFPNTLAGVIYQAGAFDAVSDGQINLTPNEQSRRAARDALNGWDPTGGCLYYYNPATATSSWIWSREVRLTIGDHSFAV